LPMSVLSDRNERWIAAQKASGTQGT